MWPKLEWDFWSACLSVPRTESIGMCHHAQSAWGISYDCISESQRMDLNHASIFIFLLNETFRQATQGWYVVIGIASSSSWLYLASSSWLVHLWVTPCVPGRKEERQRALPSGYVTSYPGRMPRPPLVKFTALLWLNAAAPPQMWGAGKESYLAGLLPCMPCMPSAKLGSYLY